MKGSMHILDHSGDTVATWDTEKPETVKEAEAQFNELRAKNHLAFVIANAQGVAPEALRKEAAKQGGQQIGRFDSEQEVIIMSPQFVGG